MRESGSHKPATSRACAPEQAASALRVLFVLGGLDPRSGGPPSSAPNMWISARRAGIEAVAAISIGAPAAEGERRAMERLRNEGVAIHSFPVIRGMERFKRWGASAGLALWLLRSARRHDIIQAHGAWMASSLAALLAAKLAGKPFVLVPHESLAESDVGKGHNAMKHWLKRTMRASYLVCCDAIVLASRIEQRDSITAPNRTRSHVIYHPVVDERSPPDAPRPRPIESGCLHVGFLGRFDPKKNIELLIQAVAAVPNAFLHVAGGGPPTYERRLSTLIERYGIGERIRWYGFISAEQRPKFFAGLDVLVMPSVYECFGMVAAEAMSCGIAVIVSTSSGIAEVVERHNAGIIVEPELRALTAALERLAGDSARIEPLCREARAAARRELAFGPYGARLTALYHGLATPRRQ